MALSTRKLNKGHIRKLTALRKSLGPKIADKAFSDWLATQKTVTSAGAVDKSAAAIAKLLEKPVLSGKIKIPKNGYVVKRGRGRVIVTEVKPVVRRKRKAVSLNPAVKMPAAKKAPVKKPEAK